MRVVDALPALAAELRDHLARSAEPELARQVDDLELLSRCGCGDSFCSTFHTRLGKVSRTLPMECTQGMINLDLDEVGRILTVEVLHRPDVERELSDALRRARRPT